MPALKKYFIDMEWLHYLFLACWQMNGEFRKFKKQNFLL